ncbi:hypothetical protein ABL78_1617 [Leptomonas seymouri]|uniref:Uncharacterized protein n=1 Tax=Leptomonas seymouri TaxID=5684 RepID=A0A0N1IM96_LEPSE|nr:hypothetical protein ABL78_1617 [Leptomonas seymouri]|eukprot:KPI89284.1 hypothetical protein ABL78_1617 [Leptomonas seymouri]
MADAADCLLLTLEVEAAAARNAELSRIIEGLQEEVQQLRCKSLRISSLSSRPAMNSTPFTPAKPTSQLPHLRPPIEEPREVFLALDDLLFEVVDIRSHLPSTTAVDVTSRNFDPEATVTARALRCVAEVKKLKEALLVSWQSSAAQVAELERALGEQMLRSERQQAQFAVQRAVLERRCEDLQRQCDGFLAKRGGGVLNDVIRSSSAHIEKNGPCNDTASDDAL